ncbi:hypothetical protein [Pantoea sp. Z09]|uniref:hypothetical protein n=1 Tax=Pantoea sp. Z09 TaxID=2886821 RepID=UPI001EFCD6BE|nr:hypothetical protein [Pantoea sp. Z09]
MSKNIDRRPGLIKKSFNIGHAENLTRVFITRVADYTPGTELTRDITFTKDVRYILEFTYPNGRSPEPFRSTSIESIKNEIVSRLNGYDQASINKLFQTEDWKEIA